MKFRYQIFLLYFLIYFGIGCSGTKVITEEKPNLDILLRSQVFEKQFTGFALYDPETSKYLHSQFMDRYFTPASNTKILTLFSALNILEDKISALKYTTRNDTTFVWGTGNPAFLNEALPASNSEISFFRKIGSSPIVLSSTHFVDEHYGSGWSWDDGLYAYQTEKTALPIYGNLSKSFGMPKTKEVSISPSYFDDYLYIDIDTTYDYGRIKRDPSNNTFYYNYQLFDTIHNEQSIPIHFREDLINQLLEDSLNIVIGNSKVSMTEFPQRKTVYSDTPLDSIYKVLMQISDNFIAEQLLLNCSMELFDTMSTKKVINWIQDSLFADITDPFEWVDGSGLSRYNMFTPRSIIELLEKIYHQKKMEWIKDIFPAGGYSGTIESWYGSEDESPWVWAKTGTLSHNHCLSGYIQCGSGKILLFSFMNNHFTSSSAKVKREMEKVLRYIKENY